MANYRSRHFSTILEKLMDGWHPKAIASFLNVPYNTVTTIKKRYFKTIHVLKDRIPNRDQLSFFSNYWQDR